MFVKLHRLDFMNWFSIIFIMALSSLKLNASDFTLDPAIQDFVERLNRMPTVHNYKLEREEIIKSDNTCDRCPKHLLLTEYINNVLEEMAKDPKNNKDGELPVKINNLRFLFYTELSNDLNGKRQCNRYMDFTQNLEPTKFDGQFKLVAEDALKFKSVASVQYMNPNLDEVVYYYRGQAGDKDVVVQAIMNKNGGRFRYFRYTPTEKEKGTQDLPEDLDKAYETNKEPSKEPNKEPNKELIKNSVASRNEELSTESKKVENKNNAEFGWEVEKDKKFKIVPVNVHVLKAVVDENIFGEAKLEGKSDISLVNGNVADFIVKGAEGKDLAIVHLKTDLTGKTEHRVIIPYSIRLPGESDILVQGQLQHEVQTQIATMSLTGSYGEIIKAEYRKNTDDGTDSFVLSKKIQVSTDENISMKVGKREDNRTYLAVSKTKKTGNISYVLQLDSVENGDTSLRYTINGKFN